MIRYQKHWLLRGLSMLAILLLSGCSSLSYYTQLAEGQLHLLRARETVAQVIADPQRDPTLREHLRKSQQAREFASKHLHLRLRLPSTVTAAQRPSAVFLQLSSPARDALFILRSAQRAAKISACLGALDEENCPR